MLPIRTMVRLSRGTVTLRAWPATVADGYLLDLLTFTTTLGTLQGLGETFDRHDLTPDAWAAFWRLAHASLEEGQELPRPLSWADRLRLLHAMYELNDIEEAEGKWKGLTRRTQRLLKRVQSRQAHPTAR